MCSGERFQLGERSDRDPARLGVWMIDFEQQRAIGLDDERPGGGRDAAHQPSGSFDLWG